MNILIFSWRGPKHPNAGGAEISTHEHAKGWVKAGHDVTLFTSAFKGCKKREIIDGFQVIRRGGQVFGVHIEAIKWYLFSKHPEFDLVVDQFHGIPFFTPLFIKAKKLAFIHEVTKEIWGLNPLPWPFNRVSALIGEAFEPLVFKLLYKSIPFMTVSDSTRNDLIRWEIPKKNITVIHNGLSAPKKVNLFKKEKEKTLIFLGALNKDKGIEVALKIFGLISQIKKDKWKFWVVGKSAAGYLKILKLQSRKLGIEKKITFWGFVNAERKFEFLSRAHLAVNPSVREGWGLVVIEAASVGTPTIAFDVPGLKDSIKNNKTGLLSDQSTDSFAKKIEFILNNKDEYKRMCKNAYLWSKKFIWEDSAEKSIKLLTKVCRNKD